jgi:hypothetical protein
MHNPKLIKRKNHWYLIDDIVTPQEGGVAIYFNTIPVFTNFIDEEGEICSINNTSIVRTTSFSELETVMGSTNPNDGTPMLDESKFEELGVVDESDYSAPYTITFASGKQEPYLINHFVNILRVKKLSN